MIKRNSWSREEFSELNLGDKRLNERLIKLCDSLSEAPESPINQACADWAETKAAYRFFRNESVAAEEIMEAHSRKTNERLKDHSVVLAIQDTSYIIYTHHSKTSGLGKLTVKKGKNVEKIYSHGLLMHSTLAVSNRRLTSWFFRTAD